MIEKPSRLSLLQSNFPRIFNHSELPWGLECGAGWDELITTLCLRINTVLSEESKGSIQILQIKEKFGGLRFYYRLHHVDDMRAASIREAISLAEATSVRICEVCGEPGTIRRGDWVKTLCAAHVRRGNGMLGEV